jgi:hypothetical protein
MESRLPPAKTIKNIRRRKAAGQPPEITDFDVRIERGGGTSSGLELLSHKLKLDKDRVTSFENLIKDNEYLRQELVFYKESRNAM